MVLDARGIISIVVIVIYIPILIIGVLLSFRYGFAREAGWIFLVILSIIRFIGAITHILSEENPTNTTYRIIYGIMESAGVSPLLVATLGFLRTTTQYGLDETVLVVRGLRLVGLAAIIGLVLAIVAGTEIGDASKQSTLDSANNLRHASAILFAVVYGAVVLLTAYCWMNMHMILKYRKRLLTGITFTLPFLFVRVLYGVLSAFAPFPFTIQNGQDVPVTASNSNALSKFGIASSDWAIYLVMLILMEYISVAIYAVVGMITPLGRDTEWVNHEMARRTPRT
ncbi:hypothetical protein C8Q79DRAFT_1114459 [Trametes meyenii]|nr:hypothetical protein C8Q79DRAFT_1114459 [Trametes meyenii]